MSSTIYYLQWDNPHCDRYEDAEDLFHRTHFDPPEEMPYTDFDDLYYKVADVEETDLENIWRQWNRGSGYESEEFLWQNTRSMSVGDVVEQDDDYYMAASFGWNELEISYE